MAQDYRFRLDETDRYIRIYRGTAVIFDASKGNYNRNPMSGRLDSERELESRVRSALRNFGCKATLEELRQQ